MAGTLTGRPEGGPSWNPLDCAGTLYPPNLLLAGKLVALGLLANQGVRWYPRLYLPFLAPLEALAVLPDVLWKAAGLLCLYGALALFFNRHVRASCLIVGVLVLLGILSSRPTFSNSYTFVGCFLLLLGLYEPSRGPWLLRLQVAVVYFGAGLNKLLDPDWRSGQYFEFWTAEILHHDLYRQAADLLPPLLLSKGMGWLTICTELGLAAGFLLPRWYRLAIAAGVCFHGGMLVFTGGVVSWVFFYLMSASYLVFVRWPRPSLTVRCAGPKGRRLCAVGRALDGERRFWWVPVERPSGDAGWHREAIVLERGETLVPGSRALLLVLLRTSSVFVALAAAVLLLQRLA